MARYTGPVCHLCRYLGEKLMLKGEKCSTPKCPLERRTVPTRGRFQTRQRKVSDYGLRKFFAAAEKTPGAAGEGLLILLERRLDNVVYRLGFADSRAQARQITRHGHILVNGHKTDIPSFLIKSGDVIRWREASTKTEYYKAVVEKVKGKTIPSWLSLDEKGMTGSVSTLPSKDDIEAKFNGKAIIEYYSR